MHSKNRRRHDRHPLTGPVDVSWTPADGGAGPVFLRGKMCDLSDSGIRIDLPQPLPPRTVFQFRLARIALNGSGVVRHCSPKGLRYVVGAEFTAGILAAPGSVTGPADPPPGASRRWLATLEAWAEACRSLTA